MIHYRIQYRQFVDLNCENIQEGWISVVAEDSDDAIAIVENALEKMTCEYELLACEGGEIVSEDSRCELCGKQATFEAEHNLFGESSILAKYCDEHMDNIRDDFQYGNYIERLRMRKIDMGLFETVSKG
jgi:hypothetical protein